MERDTIKAFCERNNVSMTSEMVYENPNMSDMPQGSSHYKCKITAKVDGKRRQMTVFFSLGPAHYRSPEVFEVMDCLASDSCSVEGSEFESWAKDFGYDPDSRKAERIFDACHKQANKLRHLLGDDQYLALIYDTERL